MMEARLVTQCCLAGVLLSVVVGCDPGAFEALAGGEGRGAQDGGLQDGGLQDGGLQDGGVGGPPPMDAAADPPSSEAGAVDEPEAGAAMDAGPGEGAAEDAGGAACGSQPECDPAVDGPRTRETGQACGPEYCNRGTQIVTESCMDDCTWQVSAMECDVGGLCRPQSPDSQGFRCPVPGMWQWCFLPDYSVEALRCTWSTGTSPCPEGCTCEPEDCHC